MRQRAARYHPVTFKPSQGGQLMAALSSDSVGMGNYTIKRDFRRVLDREIRREGYDYFQPDHLLPLASQTLNAPSGVNLLHEVRSPTGKTAVVAGTPTTLYRFTAAPGGGYVSDETQYYMERFTDNAPYF